MKVVNGFAGIWEEVGINLPIESQMQRGVLQITAVTAPRLPQPVRGCQGRCPSQEPVSGWAGCCHCPAAPQPPAGAQSAGGRALSWNKAVVPG